jgi:hypothetical protein
MSLSIFRKSWPTVTDGLTPPYHEVDCPQCEGKGFKPCRRCNGSTWMRNRKCNTIYLDEDITREEMGNCCGNRRCRGGEIPCSACDVTGLVHCDCCRCWKCEEIVQYKIRLSPRFDMFFGRLMADTKTRCVVCKGTGKVEEMCPICGPEAGEGRAWSEFLREFIDCNEGCRAGIIEKPCAHCTESK